ncbi:MAG: recombinase family protein [Merismopediaceae bacterium]|nr:recombinase family protein [Merismopediaceae bacterium]
MRIIAYMAHDPLGERVNGQAIWGVEVDHVYEDWGSDQQLQQMLRDCQDHPPTYLLLRRLQELGPTLTIIGDRLQQIEALGIEVLTIEQDYSTRQWQKASPVEQGQQWLKLSELMTQEIRQTRQKQGHTHRRLQTLPPPGRAPYGYRRTPAQYVIDKTTAPILRDFFEYYLRYASLRAALRYIEQKYNKKFAVSTGQRWLTHPVYRGDLCFGHQDIIPNTHPAILSREEAAQIDRLLRRHRQFAPRTASNPHSLAGLVVCQSCQGKLTLASVSPRKNHAQTPRYQYLRCLRCPRQPKCPAIAYEAILTETIAQICQELPQAVSRFKSPNLIQITQGIQEKIAQKQQILNQLPSLIQQHILDSETAQLRAYKLQTEIAQLQQQFNQLPPGELTNLTQAIALPQFWLDLSETERRFYFREFIQQIQLIRPDLATVTPPDSTPPPSWEIALKFVF